MAIVVLELSPEAAALHMEAIASLEEGVTYPLGKDRFSIDHGSDYFAFFNRLGEVSYFAALDGDRVVAVCAAILRRVATAHSAREEACWYICDLKVHPDYRRRSIPWAIFKFGFPRKYPKCGSGYALSMNPGDGSENAVVRMAGRFHLAPVSVPTTLDFYSLDASAMAEISPLLIADRGPLSYRSLAGVKDIILESTGERMPLLHVQWGPGAEAESPEPQEGHTHMFCLAETSPLNRAVQERGHSPHATASVIQHRMKDQDWSFILTSDI